MSEGHLPISWSKFRFSYMFPRSSVKRCSTFSPKTQQIGFHGKAGSGLQKSGVVRGCQDCQCSQSCFTLEVSFLYLPRGVAKGLTMYFIRWSQITPSVSVLSQIPTTSIMTDKDAAVMHLEHQTGQGISADDAEFLSNFSDKAKKKVLRKVSAIISGTKRFTDKLL